MHNFRGINKAKRKGNFIKTYGIRASELSNCATLEINKKLIERKFDKHKIVALEANYSDSFALSKDKFCSKGLVVNSKQLNHHPFFNKGTLNV